MIGLKGSHYPKDVILYAVFFYLRYAVSFRGLEEILAERGVDADHATLNRWGGIRAADRRRNPEKEITGRPIQAQG